jgi:hypothetical protein
MKSFLLLVLSAVMALVSGFTVVTPSFGRAHTALEASRNKQKIASRSKWAEARGAGAAVAVAEQPEVAETEAVAEEAVEEEAAPAGEAAEEASEE